LLCIHLLGKKKDVWAKQGGPSVAAADYPGNSDGLILTSNAGLILESASAQARVSDIKRGKISQFSLDLLFRLAARAGLQPKVKIAA
jgi:hypothetical protein